MKKITVLFVSIFAFALVCSLFTSAANLRINVDFSGMDPNDTPSAEDLDAYKIENIMIAEFNAEGNILAAKQNGAPSYLIYKISADEGNVLSSLTLKSYASVNDWEVDGAPLAGNKFGVYVKETEDFNFETDVPADGANGMVGKKNHTWKLDKYVEGKNEVYVCIYFLNNSTFVDWVRFYSFDFTAIEKTDAPTTSSPETESQGINTTADTAPTGDQTTVTSGADNNSADVTSGAGVESEGPNVIGIILIAAAAVIAVIVIVAIIKTAKPNKEG